MRDENLFKEVCELLKVWFYLKQTGTVWPNVITALETRINLLLEGLNEGR
jgi:hypothetical protein